MIFDVKCVGKRTLALWITGLLVVAQHHAVHSAHLHPQEQFSSFVGLLAASNVPDVAAYHDISNYTATLPLPLLRNGIVYTGDNGRLRRVVQKLLHGESTSVGVIGGSVSYGYGVRRGSSDWFTIFTSYLHRAFPHAVITAKNGCVPAAQSEYISMCLEKFVNRNADLIFVEFATSDGYLDTSVNNPYVHAFERLIRKLLKLPNRPAVVLLNYLTKDAIKSYSLFYHTIEDHYGILAQYYQLPWLSVRDAVWLGLQNNWEGFSFQDMFLPSDMHPWLPNELGHKHVADLAVGLIQQAYLESMLRPLSTADMTHSDGIPAPMFPHNHESQNAACAIGLDLKAAATSIPHKDWQFVNEGSLLKPRWGFVSHVPNSTLIVKLDTRETASQHIPQLTTQQKVQILHHHGMFAAAAQLQGTQQSWTDISTVTATAAAAAAGGRADSADPYSATSVAETSDGLQAAMQESLRQAAAAAQMMQSGQLPAFVGRERVVGGQRSGVQLPPDARKVAGSVTSTGVEVVVNTDNGRKLLAATAAILASENASKADVSSSSSNPSSALGSSSSNPSGALSSSNSSSSDRDNESSEDDTGASSSRVLLSASNPNAVPPPLDAVHLKPAGSSIFSALGGKPNSLAQADMTVWIGYQKSYRMMGKSRLYCKSGCVCREVIVDAWHSEKTSRLAMAKLLVTQHEQCEIGVQVLTQTSSGHTKFKVTGVMVSKAVEYRSADVHADSVLMGALEEAGHVSPGA